MTKCEIKGKIYDTKRGFPPIILSGDPKTSVRGWTGSFGAQTFEMMSMALRRKAKRPIGQEAPTG